MYTKLGTRWSTFILDMKKAAEQDDKDQIFLDDFLAVCKKYGLHISEKEKKNLCLAFPGRDENDKTRVNIYPIYD